MQTDIVEMQTDMYKEAELTGEIIGIAMRVHNQIGPGFSEKIYHQAMIIALDAKGYMLESEKEFDIHFDDAFVGTFRLDLIVNEKIVIELKAVAGQMPKVFHAQTISYLKASGLEIALLINFGNDKIEVKRFARYNDFKK